MPFVAPDVTTVFEDWENPALPAWQAVNYDGSASTLVATDGQGAVSAEGGALTVAEDADQARVIPIDTAGAGSGNYLAWFFRVQDDENFYWFIFQGSGSAKLRKMVEGAATDLATDTITLATGDRLYPVIQGGTFELYRYTAGAWVETPLFSVDGQTDHEAAGPSALMLGGTDWRIGTILDVDVTPPSSGVTIYVDADHENADDDRTRTQASDPDTPLRTMQRAAALAQAGETWHDTINVRAATNADPANSDPRMYAGINHRVDGDTNAAPTLLFGDNTGNEPIVVQGEAVEGQAPICRGFNGRFLRNWVFQDFQVGYDRDNPIAYGNLGPLQSVADLVFRRIDFTSGAHQVSGWTGTVEYDDCDISSALSPSASLPLDGRGIGFNYQPAFAGGEEEAGLAWVHDCRLTDIYGNDGINAGLGGVGGEWDGAHLLVEDCLFHNVTEGSETFHTDSIQVLGGDRFTIRRNVFIGCSNALMASDYHNGLIEFHLNLSVGGAGQVQIQGTDEVRMWHNTLIDRSARPNATVIFFTRFVLDQPTKRTIRNNIFGDIQYRHTSAAVSRSGSAIGQNLARNRPQGGSTGYGTDLAGIPEFGTSHRMADLPTTSVLYPDLPANYELANTIPNPALGTGWTSDFNADRLGRDFPIAADIGCHQSDPGTPVAPVARPPYVVGMFPEDGATGVDADVSPYVELYPKPGETIDEITVTSETAYVLDGSEQQLPAALTVAAPDDDGVQRVTLDIKSSLPDTEGLLYALATYTAQLTAAIADTEGSTIEPTAWSFRVAGPDEPAVYGPDGPGSRAAFTSVTATERTTEGCVLTFNSPELEMNPLGMKMLRSLLDTLLTETVGNESDDTPPVISIGPLT